MDKQAMKTMLRTFAFTLATLARCIGLGGTQSASTGLQVPGGGTDGRNAVEP